MTARTILKEIDKRIEHLDKLTVDIEKSGGDINLLSKRLIEVNAEKEKLKRMRRAY